jgi:tetratricopeptide (TPR) repeat protein
MGGLVVATHRTLHLLRLKHFVFVLAGPAVNCLLAGGIWHFLDPEQLWSFRPLEHGLQFELMFFYANLLVLIENLWPHNLNTPLGVFPSDGKQLFLSLFLSREAKELHHSANFALEASVCHQRGDYAEARTWVEKGLALYPDNEALLNWIGVVLLELCEYEKAREYFRRLLARECKHPLLHPLMLNNIAYANALQGGEELLKEADKLSQQAMEAVGWIPAVKGTRGTVLVALGRFDAGIELLLDSMSRADLANHKAQNACLLAEAEARRGNLETAWHYLGEARKLDPKCVLLKRAEAILQDAGIPAG